MVVVRCVCVVSSFIKFENIILSFCWFLWLFIYLMEFKLSVFADTIGSFFNISSFNCKMFVGFILGMNEIPLFKTFRFLVFIGISPIVYR